MTTLNSCDRNFIGRRIVASFVLAAFLLNSGIAPVRYAYGQELSQLPQPGIRVNLSSAFMPPLLKGVKVYPDNPFKLDFILDKGDSAPSTEDLKTESTRLIKYFLASITVPEKDLWVNLSPYEKDRIVPDAFGVTEMGRDLLAQDYMLKQITASVIYPEEKIGKEFWDKVYAEARKRYGSTDVPIDTFNKVWIVPEKAVVYENKDSAYVVESRLKVLLEEDYLALEKGVAGQSGGEKAKETNKLGSEIVREIVIPILEKEVNEGKNFAQLRQVYESLILAIWFKDRIKESIFGKAYVDQEKTGGVDIADKAAKDKIWAQYVVAFKKGAYNYIKEDYDPVAEEVVARKYFSGGAGFDRIRKAYSKTSDRGRLPDGVSDSAMVIESNFKPFTGKAPRDMAMKQELKSAFSPDKSYQEQVVGLVGRQRFKKTPNGYKASSAEGMSLIYPIANSVGPEDVLLQGKLERLAADFFQRLSPSLRAKIASLENRAFHVTTFDLESVSDKKLADKVKNIMTGFTRDLPDEFKRSTQAKVIGIDMFTPGVIKFALEWDREFFTALSTSIENELRKDDDIRPVYDRGPEWSKAGKYALHITLGYLMEPLTTTEIDELTEVMAIESAPEKHIDFQLSAGQMMGFKDANTLFPLRDDKAMSSSVVLDVLSPESGNVDLVGSKAANLKELASIPGISVPNGFSVTTEAFQRYIKSLGIDELIQELEEKSEVWKRSEENAPERKQIEATLKELSQKIQGRIESGDVDSVTEQQIIQAYKALGIDGENGLVAVRSSATAEDMPTASFAGQYASLLNVHGSRQV